MLIKKEEVTGLSEKIRSAIDGEEVDFRDNQEGPWSILKNDIDTLVRMKNEQMTCSRFHVQLCGTSYVDGTD
ncbi:MAG: hypothetical protein PHC41_03810 [Lachnospiraceae bacterium]|nr:hypothetical protein [Lachnospiraceae bacterium]MDD3615334.1 hypothetical protein [Lachnospiraceae bacterium]